MASISPLTQDPGQKSRHIIQLVDETGQDDYIGEAVAIWLPDCSLCDSINSIDSYLLASQSIECFSAIATEAISQLEHCLQAADQAQGAGSQNDIIIAALLHDVGQFLPADSISTQIKDLKAHNDSISVGRVGHEVIGEQYLRSLGFSDTVCRLVGSHIAAKRYLTAIDPVYYNSLSAASRKSLEFQGGPFEGKELEKFMNDPLSEEMVRLRKWEDGAKVVGIVDRTPRLSEYESLIEEHLMTQREYWE